MAPNHDFDWIPAKNNPKNKKVSKKYIQSERINRLGIGAELLARLRNKDGRQNSISSESIESTHMSEYNFDKVGDDPQHINSPYAIEY